MFYDIWVDFMTFTALLHLGVGLVVASTDGKKKFQVEFERRQRDSQSPTINPFITYSFVQYQQPMSSGAPQSESDSNSSNNIAQHGYYFPSAYVLGGAVYSYFRTRYARVLALGSLVCSFRVQLWRCMWCACCCMCYVCGCSVHMCVCGASGVRTVM